MIYIVVSWLLDSLNWLNKIESFDAIESFVWQDDDSRHESEKRFERKSAKIWIDKK